jgi:CheY-like chemotaxis protein
MLSSWFSPLLGCIGSSSVTRTPEKTGVTIRVQDARLMTSEHVDVLIIEDQQFDVELIVRALGLNAPHATTAVAATAAGAIEFLQTHSPKALLLDLHLPDMDGSALLRWIRRESHCPNIPVIVLTGVAGDREWREARRLGVSAYINKTPDLQSLADHLILFKHLLARPQAGVSTGETGVAPST